MMKITKTIATPDTGRPYCIHCTGELYVCPVLKIWIHENTDSQTCRLMAEHAEIGRRVIVPMRDDWSAVIEEITVTDGRVLLLLADGPSGRALNWIEDCIPA